MNKLTDKVSLITGAGRGIGKGIAIAIAMAGSSVVLGSKNQSDWEKIMGANLKGMFLCTKSVLKGMMERKNGTIINFSSVGGRIGLRGKAVYSASKFGVVGFSKALSKELKPYNIKVHIIYPYMVDSNNTIDWSKENPLNINSVDDIADLVVYLASLPLRVDIEDIVIDPYLKG